MKKLLALFLALLMCLTAFPLSVFATETSDTGAAEATEEDSQAIVDAWMENYSLLLTTLADGGNYAHYKYVVDNSSEIQKTMDVYTAFGFYDNAWTNYFTNEVNEETCEMILMCMIEEYHYEMGVSYVDYVREALGIAADVSDFMEDLNGFLEEYTDVLDFVNHEAWGTTFEVVDYLIEAGNVWEDIREGLIEAYSQIMSVQMANGYYIEMLEYVAATTPYEPMRTAANDLIDQATTAIEDQIFYFLDEATVDLRNQGINALIDLAINSNVYTQTAKKVLDVIGDVSDVLWNTDSQYELFDALVASYYAETALTEYAIAAYDTTNEDYDAARAIFGTYATLSVRHFGENSLYNLLVVQCDGIINKIKSKLYDYSFTEYTANIAALELMEEALFNTAIEDMHKVTVANYIYCPVNVLVYSGDSLLFRVKDGEETIYKSEFGLAKAAYSAYNDEYIKVLFLAEEEYNTVMVGVDDGYVTFVKEFIEDGKFNDYSFTQAVVTPTTKITVDGLDYVINKDGVDEALTLNDDFVMPEVKEVTWETVTEATKEVVEEETKSLLEKIKEFFRNLFKSIKALFGIEDEEEEEVAPEESVEATA